MLTVIIPTYKPQSYLYECLESLISQTISYNQFEVILILNGCREPYLKNIKQFINRRMKDMNICLLQTDVPGVSNARNIGLEKAKGEYICFIDDDDIISNTYLELLMQKANDTSIVVSNVKVFKCFLSELGDDYLSLSYKRFQNRDASVFLKRSFLSTSWCKLIPKSIIAGRRFDSNVNIGEDSLFMFQISDKILNICLADENAIYYRRLRLNSASRVSRNFAERMFIVCTLFKSYFRIYFCNLLSYNFFLFLSRIFAASLKVFKI